MDKELTQKVAEYIGASDECMEGLIAENAALKKQPETTEKEAAPAEEAPAVDEQSVESTVSNMVDAGFLQGNEKEAAVEAIKANPSVLLDFIGKLASNTIEHNKRSVPSLGKGTDQQKVASHDPHAESDTVYDNLVRNLKNKQ